PWRGLSARAGSHQFARWLPRRRSRCPHRRAHRPCRHPGRGHLYAAGCRGAPARPEDQVRPADGRGLSAGHRTRRDRKGRRERADQPPFHAGRGAGGLPPARGRHSRHGQEHHFSERQKPGETLMKLFTHAAVGALALAAAAVCTPAGAQEWSLEKAAEPYKGTEINVVFLDRPGYRAIIQLLPEFEKKTGIKVNYEIVPYESSREKQVLNFSSNGDLTIALVDLVWIGEFAENGWIVPIEKFTSDPAITDPKLNLDGFFPLLLRSEEHTSELQS